MAKVHAWRARAGEVDSRTMNIYVYGLTAPFTGTTNRIQAQWNDRFTTVGASTKVRNTGNFNLGVPITGLRAGTRYYFRVRASTREEGYGRWSEWNNVVTWPEAWVKDGSFKGALAYVKQNGQWKLVDRIFIKRNGVWR